MYVLYNILTVLTGKSKLQHSVSKLSCICEAFGVGRLMLIIVYQQHEVDGEPDCGKIVSSEREIDFDT